MVVSSTTRFSVPIVSDSESVGTRRQPSMAAALESIEGVILPCDLLPDDTTLIYEDGRLICERDLNYLDEEAAANIRNRQLYKDLSLAYYNGIHGTDYRAVQLKGGRFLMHSHHGQMEAKIRFGFTAAPSTAVDSESAAKYFYSELSQVETPMEDGEVIVTSCCIKEDVKPTFCDPSERDKEELRRKSRKVGVELVPLSEYSHVLADGVTLSEKAKLRIRFPLLALAYYNKKQRMDYKLVDVLPISQSTESSFGFVAHFNFVARQSGRADASNKLFFAELIKRKDVWVVLACRVVRGKTTAGCHYCLMRMGKMVIHPSSGFRFGLYPERRRLPRRGPSFASQMTSTIMLERGNKELKVGQVGSTVLTPCEMAHSYPWNFTIFR